MAYVSNLLCQAFIIPMATGKRLRRAKVHLCVVHVLFKAVIFYQQKASNDRIIAEIQSSNSRTTMDIEIMYLASIVSLTSLPFLSLACILFCFSSFLFRYSIFLPFSSHGFLFLPLLPACFLPSFKYLLSANSVPGIRLALNI